MKTADEIAREAAGQLASDSAHIPMISQPILKAIQEANKPANNLLNQAYDALNEALAVEPLLHCDTAEALKLEAVFNALGEYLGK